MKSEITKEGSPKKKYRLYIFAVFLAVIMALSCVAIFASDSEDVAAAASSYNSSTKELTLSDDIEVVTSSQNITLGHAYFVNSESAVTLTIPNTGAGTASMRSPIIIFVKEGGAGVTVVNECVTAFDSGTGQPFEEAIVYAIYMVQSVEGNVLTLRNGLTEDNIDGTSFKVGEGVYGVNTIGDARTWLRGPGTGTYYANNGHFYKEGNNNNTGLNGYYTGNSNVQEFYLAENPSETEAIVTIDLWNYTGSFKGDAHWEEVAGANQTYTDFTLTSFTGILKVQNRVVTIDTWTSGDIEINKADDSHKVNLNNVPIPANGSLAVKNGANVINNDAVISMEFDGSEYTYYYAHLSTAMGATAPALLGSATEVTYTLLQNDVDVAIARISAYIDSKDFTNLLTVNLDLNGKTYTASVMDGSQVKTKSIDVYPGQTWNIYGNGTITTSLTSIASDANNTIAYQLIQSYGILNIQNVTIDMSGVTCVDTSNNMAAAVYVVAGTTTLGTGTIITMASDNVGAMTAAMLYDNVTEQNYLTHKPTLVVDGATVTGELICGVTDWRNQEDNTDSYICLNVMSGTVNGAISMVQIHRNGGTADVTLDRCCIMLDDDVAGTHPVTAPIAVTKAGSGFTMYYGSMDVAVDAADTGSTITLSDNVTVYESVTISKDLTIVGNTYYSITIWKVNVMIDGNFVVNNAFPVIATVGDNGHLYIKVTYDLNYSESPAASSSYSDYEFDVGEGEPIGHYSLPAAPTRAGYEFVGWFTAPTGGTEVTSGTILTNTSAHTLYARWAEVYTVAYDITNAQAIVGGTAVYHEAFESATITPNEHYVLPASVTVTMGGAEFTAFTYEGGKVTIAAGLIEGNIVITGACARQTYVVTLAVDGEGNGTISPTSIADQPYGATYTVNGATLTIGGTAIVATPTTDTDQYDYNFEGWYIGETPVSASFISGATTFTAKFTKTVKCYNLEVNSSEGSYGSVKLDDESACGSVIIQNIPYNAEISIANNSLSVTDKDSVTHVVMAIPAEATTQWQYSFVQFDIVTGTKITGNTTVTAEFSRSAREYNVTIDSGIQNGTVAASPESGAVGTEITLTITPAAGYQLKSASYLAEGASEPVAITGTTFEMPAANVTVTAEFELIPVATYDVTIVVNNTAFGTVDVSEIDDVPANSTISVSGSTLTINGITVTAAHAAITAQYTYAFDSWSVNDGDKVTSDLEITATFTQEVRQYSITLDLAGGKLATTPAGFEKVSDQSYIGWFDYGTDANVAEIPTKDATAEYTYAFDKWNIPFPIHVTESTMTVALYKETPREYTVTFDVAGNGTVDVASVPNVPYGSAFAVDGKTVTINGTTVTVTIGADTEKYTYTFEGWNVKNGDTVAGDTAVAAIVTEFTKPTTTETAVEFISDSTDETVTASVDAIKSSDKDNVVIGKDSSDDKWSVELPKSYFSDKTDSVSVTVKDVSEELPDTIPAAQKEKLAGMTVVSLDMVIGEQTQHQFGQKVSVKLAYTLKEGQSADNLFVYYVNTETGALEKYDVTYADGFVTFETDHFSFWAIGEDNASSGGNNQGLLLAVLLVASIVAPIIIALVVYRKN